MQPTPVRLSQALWTAFRAAKPVHRQPFLRSTRLVPEAPLSRQWPVQSIASSIRYPVRTYSDVSKKREVADKVKDAEQRIEQSLAARAEIVKDVPSTPKSQNNETIVHTVPEASSIVYTKDAPSKNPADPKPSQAGPDTDANGSLAGNKYAAWASSQWQNSPLPSQIANYRSRATKRFYSFMDNFQSQIVVAAHHLNDLTGYSAIERLKQEIEAQEAAVQQSRQSVKDSRDQYSQAIASRSSTQREVNDLLHRKHAWSPTDLERFTHLYRSDHANEQTEQKSHQQLSEAEAQYEEASTRLAKSILARYHEEQIWSDKIRQMSTWGTWGLMGLNVLLFIVFQIAIEPWRRRRLVRGFEEKVQKALDEKERVTDEKLAAISAYRDGNQVIQEAAQQEPEGLVITAATQVAEAIADAVSGATESEEQTSTIPQSEEIEVAVEQVAAREIDDEESQVLSEPAQAATTSVMADAVDADLNAGLAATSSAPNDTIVDDFSSVGSSIIPRSQPVTWQEQVTATYQQAAHSVTQSYAHYSAAFIRQFNDKEHVVLSRKDLTTRLLEGVAAGVALSCGIMFIVARGR